MAAPIVPSGFGSPDAAGLTSDPGMVVEVYDLGFGSPSTMTGTGDVDFAADWGETGFGSPLWILDLSVSPDEVRDDGGTVIDVVAASWPYAGQHTVTLIDADGTETPCYGLELGEGADYYVCRPSDQTRLRFASPRLSPGTYSVRVQWISDTLHTTELDDVLTVVYRSRFPLVYEVKARFQPGPFSVGQRHLASDRLLGG